MKRPYKDLFWFDLIIYFRYPPAVILDVKEIAITIELYREEFTTEKAIQYRWNNLSFPPVVTLD